MRPDQVLAGVVIVFSRVYPKEHNGEHEQKQKLWVMAERFGALCSTEVHAGVTHVIAAMHGTEKVRYISISHCFISGPDLDDTNWRPTCTTYMTWLEQ